MLSRFVAFNILELEAVLQEFKLDSQVGLLYLLWHIEILVVFDLQLFVSLNELDVLFIQCVPENSLELVDIKVVIFVFFLVPWDHLK